MALRLKLLLLILTTASLLGGCNTAKEASSGNLKQVVPAKPNPEPPALIAQLDDPDVDARRKAAEALAKQDGADIVDAIRKRAEIETDFCNTLWLLMATEAQSRY